VSVANEFERCGLERNEFRLLILARYWIYRLRRRRLRCFATRRSAEAPLVTSSSFKRSFGLFLLYIIFLFFVFYFCFDRRSVLMLLWAALRFTLFIFVLIRVIVST